MIASSEPAKPENDAPEAVEHARDIRQLLCDHDWHFEWATVYNRLVTAQWCRKCKVTPTGLAAIRALAKAQEIGE
jgi:hypothetical protein